MSEWWFTSESRLAYVVRGTLIWLCEDGVWLLGMLVGAIMHFGLIGLIQAISSLFE